MNRTIVIVGATSAIATHCARLWVHDQQVHLTLIGRDLPKLTRVALDLRARSPKSVIEVKAIDLLDPIQIEQAVAEVSQSRSVDIALIAHGALGDQRLCEGNLAENKANLLVNAVSPVLFAEAFCTRMALLNLGTVALIGSVAGDRGRRSNYVYGAAKGLVARYAQGLQHRFANTKVKVVLIKPGPTETPMTAHLTAKGAKLASVESVAQSIVRAIASGQPECYVPKKWYLIMSVIRHLPRFIFNKINI